MLQDLILVGALTGDEMVGQGKARALLGAFPCALFLMLTNDCPMVSLRLSQ